MLKELMDALKNILVPMPKGKTVSVLRVSPNQLSQINDALKKQLGHQEAELAQKDDDIKKLETEINKLKGAETEEEKVVKELLGRKVQIERRKEDRRVRLTFSRKPKVLTYDSKLYTDGVKKYPFLDGLELEDTENGFGWNLILVDTDKEGIRVKKTIMRASYGLPLSMIFANPENLVSALKSGIVTTLFDSATLYHPPREIEETSCSRCAHAEETYDMISSMKKKYEKLVAVRDDKIDELRAKVRDTLKREVAAQSRAADLETARGTADFRADMTQAQAAAQMDKFKSMASEHLSMMTAAQDSEFNRLLAESVNDKLVSAFKERLELKGMKMSQEDEDRIEEKVREQMLRDVEFFERIFPTKFEKESRTEPAKSAKSKEPPKTDIFGEHESEQP